MQHQKLNIKISYLNNETPILQMFGIANACSVCVKMLLGSELRIIRGLQETVAKVGLGIALIYAGPVAIVYGVADLTFDIVTGRTITDRIASGIDNSRLGTDFNIFSELND